MLTIDQRTLRNLDVLEGPGRQSLFSVLNATRTAMGSRLLRAWLTHPLRDRDELGRRHDALAWAAAHPIEREQCQAVLRGIPDLGRLADEFARWLESPGSIAPQPLV